MNQKGRILRWDRRAWCLLIWSLLATAGSLRAESDSLRTLTRDDFYGLIIETHPVVRQAELMSEQARQEIRFARGFFDPKFITDFSRKEFRGTDYYNNWYSELKVPIWLGGVDLKAGFERNVGTFVNDENITDLSGNRGLTFVGLVVPLGQGMFIDERRTVVRQAELFQEIAEAERISMINKILLSAAKDYWDWYAAQETYRYVSDGFELADVRYRAVKNQVIFGDLAPIDSVEAKIILQQRGIDLQQAQLDLRLARLRVSNYLWDEQGMPLELSTQVVPERAALDVLPFRDVDRLLLRAEQRHPDLVKLEFKYRQLELEQRWNREMLKPIFNVQYNMLSRPREPVGEQLTSVDYLANNYKAGFFFSWPIFLRKERGKLQLTTIKAQQTNLERMQRTLEIRNAVQGAYSEVVTTESLVGQQREMVLNHERLVSAELRKFDQGESSLFLINTRETFLINAQVKLAELRGKYEKALATLYFESGTLAFVPAAQP